MDSTAREQNMPFDSPDLNLGALLEDIRLGKVQLPDFPREWKG